MRVLNSKDILTAAGLTQVTGLVHLKAQKENLNNTTVIQHLEEYFYVFMFMHLADTFIQSASRGP